MKKVLEICKKKGVSNHKTTLNLNWGEHEWLILIVVLQRLKGGYKVGGKGVVQGGCEGGIVFDSFTVVLCQGLTVSSQWLRLG